MEIDMAYVRDGNIGLKGILSEIFDHVLDEHGFLSDLAIYGRSQYNCFAGAGCAGAWGMEGYLPTWIWTPSLERRVILVESDIFAVCMSVFNLVMCVEKGCDVVVVCGVFGVYVEMG